MRSDLELLEAWGSGELDAGNALFERYLDALYRFFRNKVRDDVSDLVQQTLLACVEGRSRLRSDSSFRSYLFQTARHHLYAHYRLKKREAQIDPMRTTALDLGISPSQLLVQMQEERILLCALQRVPLESQMLLELVYQEELSSPEVAQVFGISAAAVRGRHARAVQQLRKQIAEREGPARPSPPTEGLPKWIRHLFEETRCDSSSQLETESGQGL